MHSKPRRYLLPKTWQKYPREPSARTPARAWLSDFDFYFYCRFVFFCRVRARGARGTAPARRGEGEQVPSSGVSSSARGGWGRLSARSARGGRARFPGARGAGARASAAAAWAAAGAATAGRSSNGQARVRTSEAEHGHVRTRLASATCRRGITRVKGAGMSSHARVLAYIQQLTQTRRRAGHPESYLSLLCPVRCPLRQRRRARPVARARVCETGNNRENDPRRVRDGE